MKRWFRNQKEALKVNAVDADVDRLKEQLGVELGLEGGMHEFPPEEVAAIVAAELQRLSEKRYGLPGPQMALLLEQEAELRKQRQEVEERRLAYLSRRAAQPPQREMSVAPAIIRWRSAVASVAAIFALIGLWMESQGIVTGWRGWAALALTATLAAVNLPGLLVVFRRLAGFPAWAGYWWARCREYSDYRRALAQAEALDERIAWARLRREAEAERRDLAEGWVAQTSELIRSHHAYHKTKGAMAARLAVE